MRILALTKRMPWYGRHSGYYSQLPRFWSGAGVSVDVVMPRRTPARRIVGGLCARVKGWPARDQSLTFAELVFRARRRGIGAVLSLEDHLPLFAWRRRKAPREIIPTIHFPFDLWSAPMRDALAHVASAIVLYRKDVERFEEIVGPGRVRFIRHGVDTEFFAPGPTPPDRERPELVYVGQFYRNFEMLVRVVQTLARRHTNMMFHLVVPEQVPGQARTVPYFRPLDGHPSVRWHTGIDEVELRAIYRRSMAMLLPMDTSGANNAVVEALACGLPIVTTDVGGIRDYGGGDIFPVVANNDDDGMISLAERIVSDPAWQTGIGQAVRRFAVRQLSWERIAREHLECYRALAAPAPPQ